MRVAVAFVLAGLALTAVAEPDPDPTPELVVNRCQACHGEKGSGAIPGWPAIAGLPAAEFSSKLKGYRSRQNPDSVMAGAAHDLSDEEIEVLSRYYERVGH